MEPQIIEYYNELPYYANVIHELNDEYEELLIETQNQFSIYNNYEKKFYDLKKEFNDYKKKEIKLNNNSTKLILAFILLYNIIFITIFL